jgi:hypothetical protein
VSGGEQKAFNRKGRKENRKAKAFNRGDRRVRRENESKAKVPITAADLTRV